ncbi:MAG: TlpA disulfide reductase family protein [Pseudoxanthomonas sp.]
MGTTQRIAAFALSMLLSTALAAADSTTPTAPTLALTDVDGKAHALSEWAGRPLLLNYWATWCGPCLKELPELQAFSRAQPADGVRVVGVALDEPEAIGAWLGKSPAAYPILVEVVEAGEPGSSARFGNAHGVLPYSVLIDAHGRVLKTKAGPLTRQELQAWTALLQKR